MPAESQTARDQQPLSRLPIHVINVGSGMTTGDINLVRDTGQVLGADAVKAIPNTCHSERFTDAIAEIKRQRKLHQNNPVLTIFLSFANSLVYGNARQEAKKLLAPALWLNLNNDLGNGNCDLRFAGIDLQISQSAFRSRLDRFVQKRSFGLINPHSDGICYLDALPAAPLKISREDALKWFRENHDLTLKAPVTTVSLGIRPDYESIKSIISSLPQDGSLLVTSGPRTALKTLPSKSPRRAAPAMPETNAPELLSLYHRADFFHTFSGEGENPYPYLLAAADRGIATSDSMSVPSDFIAAGVPVALTSDYRWYSFPRHLVRNGYATWLQGENTVWGQPPMQRPNDILRKNVGRLIKELGL